MKEWYEQVYIKFELLKQLNHKYLSYMFFDEKSGKYMLRRYFFGYNLQMLDEAFKKIGDLCDKRFYADLAHWNNMIPFSWDVKKRKGQKEQWDSMCKYEVNGFDFALDFDCDSDWKKAYKHCRKVTCLFDEYKVPYSVNWSGSKGFHIRVADKWFPKWKVETKVSRYLLLAKYLKGRFKLGTLDLQIYDMHRILKLPYSIDGKTGLVVLPLDKRQFDNFYPSMCYPSIVIRNVMIKNRGLVEREGSAEGIKRLFKEVM